MFEEASNCLARDNSGIYKLILCVWTLDSRSAGRGSVLCPAHCGDIAMVPPVLDLVVSLSMVDSSRALAVPPCCG